MKLDLILGTAGFSIYLNNVRVAGRNSWGGVQIASWPVDAFALRNAMKGKVR